MLRALAGCALLLALVGCGGGGGGGGGGGPTLHTLTVALDGAGTGTVVSAPTGIACGTDCTEAYAAGLEAGLTATPAAGSVFSGWAGACSGTGPCSVKLDAAKSVSATFARASYQLSGLVFGLTTTGLTLKSGPNRLTLAAGAGSFSFGPVLSSGMAYEIAVEHQPLNATCKVVNGQGSIGFADVTSPTIHCNPQVASVWRAGAKSMGAATSYGVLGQASPGASPGARTGSLQWVTPEGLVWLYSGNGVQDPIPKRGQALSDLWTFDARTSQWTWRGGFASGSPPHVAASGDDPSSEKPGSRYAAATWISPSGELWLFGGRSIQQIKAPLNGFTDTVFSRNDLWMLNPANLRWKWMGGTQEDDHPGRFETRGVASATAVPPARAGMATWVDATGSVWIFGGLGPDAAGLTAARNDLWKFTPATGQWTWVVGSNTTQVRGTYGTQGVASDASTPGARSPAAAWRDGQGRLCLYGGVGLDANGAQGDLVDLWCFDTTSNRWTWLAGSSLIGAGPVFGEQGIGAPSNTPGGRSSAAVWVDRHGSLWLYGGLNPSGWRADLWRLDPSTWQWTWVAGPSESGVAARHGELGVAATGNWPGSRSASVPWTDAEGALWLFGGTGYDSSGTRGELNDVWKLPLPQ